MRAFPTGRRAAEQVLMTTVTMLADRPEDARDSAAPGPNAGRRFGSEARPDLSVVIPAKDEAGNLPRLLAEIEAALAGRRFEIVVVDDGSSDGTREAVRDHAAGRRSRPVRLIRHDRPCGQSCAVRTGVLAARAPVVVTIDGDGQNDPAFIPALVEALSADARVGLVNGHRTGRKSGGPKRLASRFANAIRRRLLADDTPDSGCGLKAIRRDLYVALPYFDHNHRFLPALVLREGFEVRHVPVADRPRLAGRSKYGIVDRALVGVPDLLGVWWLRQRRRVRPTVSEEEFSA